jgi:hypothetical protein
MGMQPSRIAKKMGETEARVIKAIHYLVDRYSDILGRAGKDRILAEQAMAIETAMVTLSQLAKEARADIRIQAIRAREELRKDWLNLLAQAGLVKVQKASFFDSVTEGMSVAQKQKLIKLGQRRLKQLRKQQEKDGANGTPQEREAAVH